MTALMAAVAQRHAVEVSCPIVRREFLLWPDEERRLFGGIDRSVSPVSEISGTAAISAKSWKARTDEYVGRVPGRWRQDRAPGVF